jgi:hypothetical protein
MDMDEHIVPKEWKKREKAEKEKENPQRPVYFIPVKK